MEVFPPSSGERALPHSSPSNGVIGVTPSDFFFRLVFKRCLPLPVRG